MASNIILATPTENTTVDYTLPEGDSAKLSIASSDIVGLKLNESGGLLVNLKDGGSILISNFKSFVDGGNTLSLADGIDVDPKLLAAGVGAGNDNALGEISDAIRIGVPAEGTTREISLESGKKYLFDFDISQTQGANVDNGTMTIAFSNGSKIVIPNYETAMAGDVPPELSLTSKTCVVTAEELITNIQNLAKSGVIEETTVVVVEEEEAPKPKSKLAAADLEGQDDIGPGGETAQQYAAKEPKPQDVEPAAGEAELIPQQLESIEPAAGGAPAPSNRGGYGYNSSPGSDPFTSNPDIGPLGQTNLSYNAPEVEPVPAFFANPPAAAIIVPIFDHVVDETDMNGATTSVSGDINIDFGSDLPNPVDPYRFTGVYQEGGSIANNVLSSNGVPINVVFTNGSATGWAGAVKVFDLVMNTYTGEYKFTLYQQLDHKDGTNPNDGIVLTFGMVGVDGDNDKVDASIRITVLDDAPIVGEDTNGVDETALVNGPLVAQGTVGADYGEDGPGTLATDGFTASGSMANNTLSSNGVPVQVTANGNGWVGMAGNVKVFELTFDPVTGNYTYTQYENLDHGDPDDANDIITLTFGLQIVDYDTDKDPGKIVILVRDDAPTFQNGGPQPDKGLETVDETNLGPVVETGKLDANFGADTPGSYAFTTGGFSFSGSAANNALTSHGVPVQVSIVNGVYVGKAGNVEIFTLTLDPATGDYVFTLKGTLDHKDVTNPDDVIVLDFKVDAIDFEGDTVVGSIRVNVKDDGPSITGAVENVDESNLVIVEQGDLTENFGKDGGGVISTIPGSFVASGSLDNGVSLTSGGQPVVVTASATGYEGKVGNTVIFTLTINPTTGAYTYTQYKGLDHADNTQANDIITLTFGAKITDYDGDTAATNIVINIADDVPSFPPPPPPPGGGQPNPGDGYNIVDETDIVPAGLVVTGDLNANFGADVPGSYAFTTFTSSGSKLNNALTSNGVPVQVAIENGVYVGKANGVEVFRLTLNTTTGEYTFTLKGNLDHQDATDPNDVIRLTFGVNALDSEGEAAAGTIVIDVKDDVPVANDDSNAVDAGQTVTGDVNVNDKDGQDDPADITFVKFGNNPAVAIPADGSSVDIIGAHGTLTINKHGVYSYKANANGNGIDNFTYTLRDYDGDTDPAVLSITVRDLDTTPIIVDPAAETVDETFLPGGITETGTIVADFKADGPGTFSMNGTFTSGGSKLNNALTHNGATVQVTNTATGYEGKVGNLVIFTLTINPQTGAYVFRLFENLDHANGGDPNDVITLNFGITATDSDGDSDDTTLTVNVLDDAPTISGSGGSVDESDLGPNPLVFNGDLTENFGQDGAGNISTIPGSFVASGSLDNGVSLTSGGQPVVVTASATGYEGKVGNTVIFTLTINPTTGAYTYTQYKGLDHQDNNNPNDIITLTFGAKITDWDGDTATTNIVINVADDVPSFPPPPPPPPGGQPKPGEGYNIVDETNLVPAGLVVSDTVVADFGADTPGTYGFRNSFDSTGSKTNGALTSNGVAVDVALVNGVWVGTANGNEVFRLTLNTTTGQYTFTLKDTLDHANKNDPNDVIRLTFGIVARDSEGEGANGTIVIDVVDDAPTIVPGATLLVKEADLPGNLATASSNLGIDFNNDGPGAVSTTGTYAAGGSLKNGVLSSSGVAVQITSTANGYVGKANGVDVFTLTINPNTGAYTFTLLKKLDHADDTNPNDIINLSFGVKITDFDGDTATTNILVNVMDDGPVILPPPVITKPDDNVDESNLSGGAITEGGTIVVNYQGAGPGTVGTTGSFTSGGSKLGGNLTSNGSPVTVTHNGNTYTGKNAGGTTIFTLTVAADGKYTFRLFEQLDHNNGSDPNDVITLNFGINATNNQGTSSTSTLTINVADDAPLAHRDDCTVFIHEGSYNSNLIVGDDIVGQDAPGVISRVIGLSSVNISSSGTTTVQGQYGTLNIKADGSYTYTLKAGVAHGSVEVFTYTLKDFDGDTSTANLTISILANFNGTSATDVMHGSSGNDSMFGNGGVDYLYGEGGDDVMDGGSSADYMEGNEGNDTMYGGSGNDYLYGDGLNTSYVGHDTLYGGDGNDILLGGRGNDVLTGGSGADQFWIMSMNGGLDTIKDFSISEGDKIDLANVLTKYDPVTESINDFVFAQQSGGNTTIYVNANGTGGIGQATALIVLEGVSLTLNQLKNSIVTE